MKDIDNNIIEKYCNEQGDKLAQRINEKMVICIKPRPKWCPQWLYKKIIRESVQLTIRESVELIELKK